MQRAAARAFLVSLVFLFATSARAAAPADAYPNKTIRYVIPFPPGGITDLMARTIAQKTSDAWKQSVVIDNRPGANALLGADLVAKSTPDGYTWLGMTIRTGERDAHSKPAVQLLRRTSLRSPCWVRCRS